ncbi:ABC Superfamily [Phytophthora palmivora]|uniref:ABC Superfamily n=1 Tax=Phytophthora palmivora TaxID=4796 RepID=A0A2P4XS05_9STRA|nr:ABC Superfamily [Phytophthora palmivora]
MQFFVLIVVTFALLSSEGFAKSDEEIKSIDELYADAVAEGGNLIMYHGGDTPTQQDALQEAFSQRFPEINFTLIVDYSKYHDVRIDNQLETDTLVPDLVALQTLQDFPRWAKAGELLKYKPANFSRIHESLRDTDGAWMAYTIMTFGYKYNSSALDGYAAPTSPVNLTDAHWAGKIASSYPNDDDAVLFLFTRYVNAYGWEWVAKMAQQNISFNRGTNVAGALVKSGEKVIGVGTGGGSAPIEFVGGNGIGYLSWGQRLAILSKAKHPAAAKLFMNWVLSEEAQTSVVSTSVRTDVNSNKPWDIPEANMAEFPKFMENRALAEEWRQTFTLYIGEVQGKPSPGWLGLHPGQ